MLVFLPAAVRQVLSGIQPKQTFGLSLDGTLTPEAAKGSAIPSFTRSTTATVVDFEGLVRTCKANESRFSGYRRVENILGNSINSSQWGKVFAGVGVSPTLTDNAGTDPLGGNTAVRLQCSLGGGTTATDTSYVTQGSGSGTSYVHSIYLKSNTGASQQVAIGVTGNPSTTVVTVTTTWQRFSLARTIPTLQIGLRGANGTVDSCDILFYAPMSELVTGQSNQNPSEYVPIGGPPTSPLGPELVPDGDFSSTANWTVNVNGGGAGSVDVSGGAAVFTGAVNAAQAQRSALSVPIGTPFAVTYIISSIAGGGIRPALEGVAGSTRTVAGTYTDILAPAVGNPRVFLTAIGTTTATVTLVSVKQCLFPANVDGVRYFSYLNGNTVTNNVVTEAKGFPLPTTPQNWVNYVKNSMMVGAVAPGTSPTGWTNPATASGITSTVVGVGIEDGYTYIDYRWQGTATAGTTLKMALGASADFPAVSGQTISQSYYARITAGSLANLTGFGMEVAERNSGGSLLITQTQQITYTGSSVAQNRQTLTRTLNQATAAFCSPSIFISFNNGAVIDITVRIAAPQWELASTATQFKPTYGTAVNGFCAGRAGYLTEGQRVNFCLQSNDLSNASWVKTNCTAALTATGVDGAANSASTLTATLANATCLQAITRTSAARITGCRIKRRTGTGTINMTQDNGTTWTPVTVTSAWTRVSIPSATLANPTIGFQIVTSGDAIDVQYVQHEEAAMLSSDIATTTASVTRNADSLTYLSAGNIIAKSGTVSCEVTPHLMPLSQSAVTTSASNVGGVELNLNGACRFQLRADGGTPATDINVGSASSGVLGKYAGRWGSGKARAFMNGITTGEVSNPSPTSLGSQILIGNRTPTANVMYGSIRNIRIYDKPLKDPQIQALTL